MAEIHLPDPGHPDDVHKAAERLTELFEQQAARQGKDADKDFAAAVGLACALIGSIAFNVARIATALEQRES